MHNAGAELVTKPAKAVIVSASKVAAGLDFTMWLCNGRVFSAGNPQFGQLGHNSDHEYNASDCEARAPRACAQSPESRALSSPRQAHRAQAAETTAPSMRAAHPQM